MLIISTYINLLSVETDVIIYTDHHYMEKDGEADEDARLNIQASGTLVVETPDVRYEYRGIPCVLLCMAQIVREYREQSAAGKENIDIWLPDLPGPCEYVPYAGLHMIPKGAEEDPD